HNPKVSSDWSFERLLNTVVTTDTECFKFSACSGLLKSHYFTLHSVAPMQSEIKGCEEEWWS
ncbi:hypothetical protein PSI23_21975, partial [Xenorhabdus sp. XENO-10]